MVDISARLYRGVKLYSRGGIMRTPMMTIYKNGKRFEAYTDGSMIVEDMATGEVLEEL